MDAQRGTVGPDGDRTEVRFDRWYGTDPDDLWQALTDPARLARWFGAAADVEPGVGGSIALRWDGADQWVRGEITEWDPPRTLSYGWRFPGEDESYVRFELEPRGEGTLLHLVHRRLGPAGSGYGAAWHAYLDRLAALYAGEDLDWYARFTALQPTYR